MCVCVAVQFVNELLSINMNTIARSLGWQTNKEKCVCLVLKACVDEQSGENDSCNAFTTRVDSTIACCCWVICLPMCVCVAVHFVKELFSINMNTIARSLRWQTNKGKCVCLVLKACVYEQTGEVFITRCKSFLRAGATKKWLMCI